MDVNVLLFPGFEPLDVFGPVEVLLHLKGVNLRYFSLNGGKVGTYKTLFIETLPLEEIHAAGVFLLPGGPGTRKLVNEPLFLDKIKEIAEQATSVLTVCTGSALLAKTGLLDHKQATSNKRAFKWATAQNKQVLWIKKARWLKMAIFIHPQVFPLALIWYLLLLQTFAAPHRLIKSLPRLNITATKLQMMILLANFTTDSNQKNIENWKRANFHEGMLIFVLKLTRGKGNFILLLTAIIWRTNYIFIKQVLRTNLPTDLNTLRGGPFSML